MRSRDHFHSTRVLTVLILVLMFAVPMAVSAGESNGTVHVTPKERTDGGLVGLDVEPGKAMVIIENMQFEVTKGTVIPTAGEKLTDGSCPGASYGVVAGGSDTVVVEDVVVSMDENCDLVVTDVIVKSKSQLSEPDSSFRLTSVTKRGYAQARFEEQFTIDVSKVRSGLDYTDSGTSVYNGHNADFSCWARSGTGWSIIDCGPAYWDRYGPDVVYGSNSGTFDNPVGPWHYMFAHFEARPNHQWLKYCDYHIPNRPPLWWTHCGGNASTI